MTGVHLAIVEAERVLTTARAVDVGQDPRWQAIIRVAEFIPTDPEVLWEFARRWGGVADEDLRMAVATCLLEHLLEQHFEMIYPRVWAAAREDPIFADTAVSCWTSGMPRLHAARWKAFQAEFGAGAG